MDRVPAQHSRADEVKQVKRARIEAKQRLRRLGQVGLDSLLQPEDYSA